MTGILRNLASGLVLDASEYEVKLQHYNGSPSQLWRVEPAGGKYAFVINMKNGHVLDIKDGAKRSARIITYEKHGGDNQRWFHNPDNTVQSAAVGNYVLDVYEGKLVPGAKIIAYTKHGGPNQQFNLQFL